MHLAHANTSEILRKKLRTRKYFGDKKFTFGKLISEINKFEAEFLSDLKVNLKNLVKVRNEFAHRLFSSRRGMDDLNEEAKKGLRITEETLDKIDETKMRLT